VLVISIIAIAITAASARKQRGNIMDPEKYFFLVFFLKKIKKKERK